MNIQSVFTGPFEESCYLVWDEAGKTVILDPGHDADEINRIIEQHGLAVAAYVCTHGHADHINALAELHALHPAPVAMHSNDLKWAFNFGIEPYYPVPAKPGVDQFELLETAKDWTFSGLRLQCIHTPGHTPGSCCILFPEAGYLISGDTLFKGSCGRTDLPGGDPRALKNSLNKLKQLPDEIRVFPGHGPDTTIGIERATNFFMQ
ncbi:MAG TPA: MBL fold metallo-hydrolase [Pontiella sp.]